MPAAWNTDLYDMTTDPIGRQRIFTDGPVPPRKVMPLSVPMGTFTGISPTDFKRDCAIRVVSKAIEFMSIVFTDRDFMLFSPSRDISMMSS